MVPSETGTPRMVFDRSPTGQLLRTLGVLACAAGLVTETAGAQTVPPSSEPAETAEVVRPVPVSTPVPDLETRAPAEVVLELVIDRAGAVESAHALSGSEPFASHAVEATATWLFRPAEVNGKPVRTRIQFVVRFEATPAPSEPSPPAPVNKPTTTEGSAPSPAPERQIPRPLATAEALEEVIVLGDTGEPLGESLSRAEVRNMAGAFGDPLRGVDIMPGVTPIATGLPLFFVRGAPPGNVGYFIDGIRIPLLYHGFLGPAVIHPAFIDNVTLNAGPMPVRFGRFAGATIEAGLASPSHALRGEGHIRLFDAGAFVEAPIANGRGYAMVGGRYSFTALLLSVLSPGQSAQYWDYQAAIGYSLSRDDEVRLFAFGAFDYFSGGADAAGGTEFHRVDLKYTHRFSPDSDIKIATTAGSDRTRSGQGYVTDTLALGRVNYEHRGKNAVFQAGGDVSVDNYGLEVDLTVQEPEIYLELFPPRTDVSFGTYANVILSPGGPVEIVPGVRVDGFSSLGAFKLGVDPRLFVNYRITRKIRASHGVGVAHQSPNFVPGIPAAQVGGLAGGLQQSIQAESRFDFVLPWDLDLSLRGFINGTRAMSDPIGLTQSFAIDETSIDQRATGRAAGLEVYVKRPLTRRLGGILSYTFMGSLRSIGEILTPPGYNRTHTLNLALSYDFGASIRGSLRMALASGIPGRRTTPDGFIFDQSASMPLFRIDAKLEKRWRLSDRSSLAANIEVLNATYTPSVVTRTCGVDGCVDGGTAPLVLPSVGVEYSWR